MSFSKGYGNYDIYRIIILQTFKHTFNEERHSENTDKV